MIDISPTEHAFYFRRHCHDVIFRRSLRYWPLRRHMLRLRAANIGRRRLRYSPLLDTDAATICFA